MHELSYLHTGSPQTWYGVCGEDFELVCDMVKRDIDGGIIKVKDASFIVPGIMPPAAFHAQQIQVRGRHSYSACQLMC